MPKKPPYSLKFVITGVQMAKLRMTGNQTWKPAVQRYIAWKNKVKADFTQAMLKQTEGKGRLPLPEWFNYAISNVKPITLPPNLEASMKVFCTYQDERHPDTEGVFGSIADALFTNDKHLRGSFDFSHDRTQPAKTEVEVLLYETENK